MENVTKKDKKEGRGGQFIKNPLVITAQKYNIPVFQVSSLLKDSSQLALLDFSKIDLAVVVSFAFILPYDIIRQVSKGFINLHPSLLPKYRGPAPIHTAIINGDTKLGISIMMLDEGMDTGPLLSCKEYNIKSNMLYPEVEKIAIEEGSILLLDSIKKYINNRIVPVPQNNKGVSVTKYIKKDDGFMTFKEKPLHIYNCYRAFYNWPGIFTTAQHLEEYLGFKLKIGDKQTIIKINELVLNTDNKLEILKLQLPNKPVISYKDFINGYRST